MRGGRVWVDGVEIFQVFRIEPLGEGRTRVYYYCTDVECPGNARRTPGVHMGPTRADCCADFVDGVLQTEWSV